MTKTNEGVERGMLIMGKLTKYSEEMIFTVTRVLGAHKVEAIGHTGRITVTISIPTTGMSRDEAGEWKHVRLKTLKGSTPSEIRQESKGFVQTMPWVREEVS